MKRTILTMTGFGLLLGASASFASSQCDSLKLKPDVLAKKLADNEIFFLNGGSFTIYRIHGERVKVGEGKSCDSGYGLYYNEGAKRYKGSKYSLVTTAFGPLDGTENQCGLKEYLVVKKNLKRKANEKFVTSLERGDHPCSSSKYWREVAREYRNKQVPFKEKISSSLSGMLGPSRAEEPVEPERSTP